MTARFWWVPLLAAARSAPMLEAFLQTGGEASVVVEAGRGLGEVAVAAAGNRLLVTSCPPAKGTMAAALPADTLIKYQGDGALATRFTLDTATGAAASVQTTFQLDPTSAAADVTVLTIDYQGTDQRVRDTSALFGATAPPTPPGPPLWRCAGRGGGGSASAAGFDPSRGPLLRPACPGQSR